MKNLYSFLFVFFSTIIVSAQQAPFITTWEVTSEDLSITIPRAGGEMEYSYTVDFGDGTIVPNNTQNITHLYALPGTYTVSISGVFPGINFGNYSEWSEEPKKLKTIEQWGNTQWQSMTFSGCTNLIINASDAPDLSNVGNMSLMFKDCISLNTSINHWNTSNAVNMTQMFSGASSFNQPLDTWDVSNVEQMTEMFSNASSFNQSLNDWDVSSVHDMQGMFAGAAQFNQPLNNWNLPSLRGLNYMFKNALDFNQNINNWDLYFIIQMGEVFSGASSFNQPLDNWNVSHCNYFGSMFEGATSFNQPLNSWDVQSAAIMANMFAGATSFDQPLDNWDVSGVISLAGMFSHATSFNQPLNDWIINAEGLQGMFYGATSFDQPLDSWNVSNAIVKDMFWDATSFNQDLSNWQFRNFPYLDHFIANSGMDSDNYDALLSRFVQLYMVNRIFYPLNLRYCNEEARDRLITWGWEITGDSPSQDCNFISGTIRYDEDEDGCDQNDVGLSGFMINFNDGNRDYVAISNNGNFNFTTVGPEWTVSVINTPDYVSVDPATAVVTFENSNQGEVNFCLTSDENITDLSIRMLAITEARPGFETHYQLIVENSGYRMVPNAMITLTFDDEKQEYISASLPPSSVQNNELNFELENLPAFGREYINIVMQTFIPPIVEGGDIMSFTAHVSPDENDYTPEDNTYVFDQVVVNSFDPNDKQVMQGEEIYIDQADEYLDYIIRFQNTGTASAINVKVADVLDPKLDWSTLMPISSSHDYYIQITNGNILEFKFDNINLPHEAGNEPESHGYIAYKIKPRSDVQIGDVISGDAGIYFDFNPPIITNTVSTEIVERTVGITDNSLKNLVRIYPNPTEKIINISLSNQIQLEELIIYNLQGQQMQKNKEKIVNVGNLSDGIYLLKIITDKGIINHRFVKI